MSNYPQHASDAEKAAWALCTGIEAALFTFGFLMLLAITAKYMANRKR